MKAIIPERIIHQQIVRYLRQFKHNFFHIQNERVNLTKIQQINRYNMGVTAGCPDICVILDKGKALWIEVKSTNGRIQESQKQFHEMLKNLGHHVIIARDVCTVIQKLQEIQNGNKD